MSLEKALTHRWSDTVLFDRICLGLGPIMALRRSFRRGQDKRKP